MSNAKKPAKKYISPRGVFVYPALTKPDFGTKDYPKPDGEFKVTLRIPAEVAEKWRETALKGVIEEARKLADAEFAKLPVATRKKLGGVKWNDVGTDEYDKATEEPTGNVLVKFNMKAAGTRKDGTRWSRRPEFFDSRGKRIERVPEIWGGTEGVISFEASPYFIVGTGAAGVSLRLSAVQICKLVQGGQRDAGDYGFSAMDDGFDSSEYQAPEADEGGDEFGSDAGGAGGSEDNPDF